MLAKDINHDEYEQNKNHSTPIATCDTYIPITHLCQEVS